MFWRVHAGSAMVKFKPHGVHSLLKRAYPTSQRGPSKSEGAGETASFHFGDGAHWTKGPSMANFTPFTGALDAQLPSEETLLQC